MNAEILAVGTELLLGQIVNSNAATIARRLASVGVDVYAHSVVGDNLGRITEALRAAMDRAEVVIVTGGLGPTPDDLTRDAVAAALGVGLERDESLVPLIRGVFERLGRDMPDENLRQADLPAGARPIAPEGTAPGFLVEPDAALVCALPGVPWEMEAMLDKEVIPLLRSRAGAGAIVSREIFVVGLGESLTHERISDIVAAQGNPTVAYLAGRGQVRVRVTAKAGSDAEAEALIAPVARDIRARLGDAAVPGFPASLADALAGALRSRGATVAVAESLTGGLIAAELTRGAGASDYFVGSVVCYSVDAKRDVAMVPAEVLDGSGPVSEEAAAALAAAAVRRFHADLGLSATGAAGPDPHHGHEPGTVFVAASWRGDVHVRRVRGYGDRSYVRDVAVTAALELGRRTVEAT